jgi:hypothetical protein
MKRIVTTVDVDAPPAVVWTVLTDLHAYDQWNPQTTRAAGAVEAGGIVRLHVEPSEGRETDLRARVTRVRPARMLEWVARLPVLFTARHRFELVPLVDGRTRVENRESLSGLLVRFGIVNAQAADYEAMNRALKVRAEILADATKDDAVTESAR